MNAMKREKRKEVTKMDGYKIVENYFKEWIETQTFIDRFYVAVFLGKHSTLIKEPYHKFFELFEYDFDGDGGVLWQIDWREGENDITNLRFYSLADIEKIIYECEEHTLFVNDRKWFNKWG